LTDVEAMTATPQAFPSKAMLLRSARDMIARIKQDDAK
jgi:hypothetical protein